MAKDGLSRYLLELLRRRADEDDYAIRDLERQYSATELLRAAESSAAALAECGLGPGDTVAVASHRGLDFVADALGVWHCGGVLVPFDTHWSARHQETVRRKSAASFSIGFELDDAVRVHPGDGATKPVVDSNESANSRSVILFTSGSTGEPKGVALSGTALLGNAQAAVQRLGYRAGARFAIATPFHFTSALCHALACLLTGAPLSLREDGPAPADFIEWLVVEGADGFGGAPIQLGWLADGGLEKLTAMRWLMSSGDRLPEKTIRDLLAIRPAVDVHTVYGLTELGGRFCTLPPHELPEHAGTVGRPIEGLSLRLRDEHGVEMGPGETGEVYASGRYMMEEYVGEPEATRAALSAGELRTGDLGELDDAGRLRLHGRSDEVIKVAGQKVSLVSVEDAIRELGLFRDFSVLPYAHPVLGTTPALFYVGREGEALQKGALLRQLRKRLPGTHLPRTLISVDEIPRTGSGKVDRAALVQFAPPVSERS